MKAKILFAASLSTLLMVVSAAAQQNAEPRLAIDDLRAAPEAPADDTLAVPEEAASAVNTQPIIRMQYFRPQDQRGINVFEPPKSAGAPYNGFQLDFGAAFTQQFQALDHENAASPRPVDGKDANRLMPIGAGFNTATANLYLNAQLAPGIRVAMTTFLSSRRHPEAWVKDGYLLIDESPLRVRALEDLMRYVTIRAGHFEINYGDAHFRRTDNGNSLYNPFVGNYIMDAFTTEVGAEAYVRANGLMAMGSVTGGEIKGNITRPEDRAPSFIGKLGFDRDVAPDLRLRLTGSVYSTAKSINNTLYGGDRAGSRYFYVLENDQATESAQPTSGLINPGFRSRTTALQFNPFVKYGGLELFGVAEFAEGRAANETENRNWEQRAVDAVYRFLPGEQLFVGARWNEVSGELPTSGAEVDVERLQFGAGWFITPSILMKGEYVTQKYNGFPATDIRHQGKFDGFMFEGVVAF